MYAEEGLLWIQGFTAAENAAQSLVWWKDLPLGWLVTANPWK
jgi:hypothetical protein